MLNITLNNALDIQTLVYISDGHMEAAVVSENFSRALRQKIDESEFKGNMSEFARTARISKQNVSRILNKTPHSITGAMPTVTRETVLKMAKVLNWNESEALNAAGLGSFDPKLLSEINGLQVLFAGSESWSEMKRKRIWEKLEQEVRFLDQAIPDDFANDD